MQILHQGLDECLPLALDEAADSMERTILAMAVLSRVHLADLVARMRLERGVWLPGLVQVIGQAIDEELRGGGERPRTAAPRRQSLSLLEEEAIEEDIALSRLVQVAERDAEGILRDLSARCTRLRGWPAVRPDAHPMRPAVVARGLQRAVAALGLDTGPRLDLLRHLAPAVGAQLAPLYARQLALLTSWRIEPVHFGVGGLQDLGDDSDGGPDEGPLATAIIAEPSAAAATRQLADDALRRLAPRSGEAAAGRPTAVETMALLLAVLLSRTGLSDGVRQLLLRLDSPARRMAETEPELWRSAEHPLWQLLDRLMSSSAVLDEIDLGQVAQPGASLDAALRRLEQADPPDATQLQAALAAMDGAATARLDAEAERLAPQVEVMQARLVHEEIEARVREQIVQEVRASHVQAALHQFLVGPWATALAATAQRHGFDSPQFRMQAEMVDALVQACDRPRNRPLSPEVYTRCMTHARLGLVEAGLPAARIEAELADLGRTLRRPWSDARQTLPSFDDAEAGARPLNAAAPAAFADAAGADETVDTPSDAGSAGDPLDLHEALATVQIDMGSGAQASTRAHDACEAWLGALEPGTLCRLFVQGRWTNMQLVWRSLDRSMFVFSGRQTDVSHSMTRATLHKLRAAGLAANVERGQFIAQALNELAQATA